MEALKRQRAALKGQVTRIVTFCESSSPPLAECLLRQTKLEQHMHDFERIQNEIEALVAENQIPEETDYRVEFESTFFSAHARLTEIIQGQQGIGSRTDKESDIGKTLKSLAESQCALNEIVKSLSDSSRRPISITKQEMSSRLPEIKIPEFSGRFDEWVRFRDLFSALVQSKSTITGVEKLEYLQSWLKGEASSIIKHISPSNENFDVAWNLVKAHYDKPQFIMVAHLDNIFEQPVLKSGSLSEIKRLFTTTSENINALHALKQPVASWDILLVYVLVKKLDSDNRMLWIRVIKDKVNPSLSDFNGFLKDRINELESLNLSYTAGRGQSSVHKSYSKDSGKRVLSAGVVACFKCKQKHFLYQCPQFRDLTVPARFDFVNSNKICINCLRVKHSLVECKFSNCKTCGLKHNTMLHHETMSQPQCQPSTSNGASGGLSINLVQNPYRECFTMLPTSIIMVKDRNDNLQPCRALLDSGSQATLISESCIQRLGLKRGHARIPIFGIGQCKGGNGTKGQVELCISSNGNTNCFSVQAFVLSSLTNDQPSIEIPIVNLSYFSNLSLADPNCNRPTKIDVLLGADIFFHILLEGRIVHPSGSPVAQETIFGWVLAGNISQNPGLGVFHTTFDIDADVLLKRFFEHEDITDGRSAECEVSDSIENHFKSTHFTRPDGRFVVSLPFTKGPVEFGDSRDAALKRLFAMEKRFSKDSNLKHEYVSFMREYKDLGHMSLVKHSDRDLPSYYLPHHAVLKPSSTTTKLRVVFDASCKSTNGFSLNDYLRVGPTIQNDLITCLIKFRKFKIAIKADIAKLYRQILINPDEVHFQRIVWRERITEEPRDYQLQTVTYGTASASFLATRVLKQIGINNIARFPQASNSIINDFYVDDFMSTYECTKDAIDISNDLCQVLESAGMKLRKWSSNSFKFLQTIDVEHREASVELPIGEGGVKTLGLLWNTELDCFHFCSSPHAIGPQVTKREVLSDIARIFDPLGWLSPTVVKMKIFMKRLWLRQIGWDTYIPTDLHEEWSDFKSDLSSLGNLRIPRWLQLNRNEVMELHGFADASESAYAAAVYSRVLNSDGVRTTIICAKTRIAPVKLTLSIPRLELCGSLLLTKLLSKVRDALAFHEIECFATQTQPRFCTGFKDIRERVTCS